MTTTSLDEVKGYFSDFLYHISGELRARCNRMDTDKLELVDVLDAIIELELDLSNGEWDAELQEAIDHE